MPHGPTPGPPTPGSIPGLHNPGPAAGPGHSDRHAPGHAPWHAPGHAPWHAPGHAPWQVVWTEVAAVLLAGLVTVAAVAGMRGVERVAPVAPVAAVVDGSFAFIGLDARTGAPVRFDPCTPIAYVVNPDGAPPGVLDDVHEAVLRTQAAAGIMFVFEGFTDEAPTQNRSPYQPDRYGDRWAPVLVGWASPDAIAATHGSAVVGWAYHVVARNARQQDVAVSGVVALSRHAPTLRPGFGSGRRWGNVMLHELGHLLGLDHVDDPAQVMYPDANVGRGTWGPGDLAGLAALGYQGGCLRVPRAVGPPAT
jgi:hypothetical protein